MEVWAQADSYSSLFDKLTTLPASFLVENKFELLMFF